MTEHVTEHVEKLLRALTIEMSRSQLQEALELKHRESFYAIYLRPSLEQGYIEMTVPDKPKSIYQKYRLTEKGKSCMQ